MRALLMEEIHNHPTSEVNLHIVSEWVIRSRWHELGIREISEY